ncbi:MAG: phosphotransferase [Pirellulales bacterium]
MHQPGYRTAQLPIDRIRRIAGYFFEGTQPRVLMPTLAEAGFSGSTTCIFTHQDTEHKYVLKQLPHHLSMEQILWTQGLATFTRNHGFSLLPVAVPHHHINGLVSAATPKIAVHTDGTLWQCLKFIDGKPCKKPHSTHTMLGAEALAAFHKVASAFQKPRWRSLCGWQRRRKQLCSMLASRPCPPDKNTFDTSLPSELFALYTQFIQLVYAPETIVIIRNALKQKMTAAHQPTLKDCWWPHLLFSNSDNHLSGIIDIDAAGWDDPAVDMARLLGSWQLENPKSHGNLIDIWPEAFQKYRDMVEPGADFPFRVQILHDTSIICGMDRWFSWIFREKREFPNMSLVLQRITTLLHAAPAALRRLEHSHNTYQ